MLKKGLALIMFFVVSGCSKDSSYGSVDDLESYLEKNSKELEQDSTENDDFNIGSIKDSYSEIAPFENFKNWDLITFTTPQFLKMVIHITHTVQMLLMALLLDQVFK